MNEKPYHHGDLAQTLMRIAIAQVEERGPENLSLRGVAQRAGVSATALYRHYADKDALMRAVADHGFVLLIQAFEDARRQHQGRALMTALGLAYVGFAQDHPHLHALMFGPRQAAAPDTPTQAGSQAFDILVQATASCFPAQAGWDKVMPAAIALWSLVHGYATLRRDGQLSGRMADMLPDPALVLSSLMVSD